MSPEAQEMITRLRTQMSPFFHRVADKLEAAEKLREKVLHKDRTEQELIDAVFEYREAAK